MTNRKLFLILIAASLLVGSCNLPSNVPSNNQPTETFTAIAAAAPATTDFTATPCAPTITANTVANVRKGPSQDYDVLGQLPQGASANVAGKNNDGSWWYIEFAAGEGGHAWVSGSVATANCIPTTLAIIAAPPLPVSQAPTKKPTKVKSPTEAPTSAPGGGGVVLPLFPINPILFVNDIALTDVFLSTGGEVVFKVAISGIISGNFQYKVWVNGGLKATSTGTLPASGSQAYWTGVVLSPDIFDPTKSVKVSVDTANAFTSESDESNNTMLVVCNSVSFSC